MSKHKINIIHWKDASSCGDLTYRQWFSKEEAIEAAKERFDEVSVSSGFVLENNKNYIVIASTKAGEDLYCDITMIPKKFLMKIFKLNE